MGCMKIDVNLQYDISTIPFYWLTTSSIDFPVYLLQQALFVSALGVGVGVGGGGKRGGGSISVEESLLGILKVRITTGTGGEVKR